MIRGFVSRRVRRSKHQHSRGEVLLIAQVYPPDPASVGQHLADLSSELLARGFSVNVLTANRGYDDPSQRYPRGEMLGGARVRRMRFCSFGKRSFPVRVLGALLFTASAAVRGMLLPSVDTVVVSTSPPTGILAAMWIAVVRRAALVYWVMDLNPDQAINLGLVASDSLKARALHKLNEVGFRRANLLVVLDEFMDRRLRDEYGVRRPILVVPPWPHDQYCEPVERTSNRFRTENAIRDDQIVLMYAGNHAESAPVATFLQAADALKQDDRVVFFFVGGGRGKPGVEAFIARHELPNVRCLPYQPLESLGELLGAGDVHMVTMGEGLVGINHPCKIYGAMSVGRPLLYVGPFPNHISVLIKEHNIGWYVGHGDVDGAVDAIRNLAGQQISDLEAMGWRARQVANSRFSRELLLGRLSDGVEELL